MKEYYNAPRRSNLSLLNILGFLFAITIFIGILDRAGIKVVVGQNSNHNQSGMIPDFGAKEQPQEGELLVVDAHSSNQQEHTTAYHYSNNASVGPAASGTSKNPEEWIERFASSARSQALEKGVPAGIALAYGIEQLNSGRTINSWHQFINEVIIPLVAIKQAAPQTNLQQYFKYSANSERWIVGLGKDHRFSASRLNNHMRKYQLHKYDQEVMAIIANGGKYQQVQERKSTQVADEVASSIVAKRIERQHQHATSASQQNSNADEWEQYYDEVVGKAVAKEIARKKLKSGQYLSEDDMQNLIDETNEETSGVISNNISFLGRKINKNHPEAEQMLDITNPKNAQAREELYQQKLREKKMVSNGNK
jgi:hypothetical protein